MWKAEKKFTDFINYEIVETYKAVSYTHLTEEELEEALNILQDFDPAGIGARSLQECLLIQIRRKKEEEKTPSPVSYTHLIWNCLINSCRRFFVARRWNCPVLISLLAKRNIKVIN